MNYAGKVGQLCHIHCSPGILRQEQGPHFQSPALSYSCALRSSDLPFTDPTASTSRPLPAVGLCPWDCGTAMHSHLYPPLLCAFQPGHRCVFILQAAGPKNSCSVESLHTELLIIVPNQILYKFVDLKTVRREFLF